MEKMDKILFILIKVVPTEYPTMHVFSLTRADDEWP